MQIDVLTSATDLQNRVQQSFRRGLPSYHDAAKAQAGIARLLVDALCLAGAPSVFHHALEFGCGTGHLTSALLQRLAIGHLFLNDLVAESAAALQPVLQDQKVRSEFYAGPVETMPLPSGLDLIASASTVQWLHDPAQVIARLTVHLAPGGWLALSGFGQQHFAELQALGGFAQAPSYLNPDDWAALLPADMAIHTARQHNIKLHFPDAISLLRHLRFTGVNARAHSHWTRANLTDFEARLRKAQPKDSPLALTYCPVILIARKIADPER